MSYTALYRKFRPSVFEDVVEQEHVVKTLRNSIYTGRIAHAYLFCGTRGTGKTTMAKIFSRAINCLHPKNGDPCNECEICKGILSGSILDVIEIDAASNNSVDNIREIRDEVIYAPSQAKYKVYIIDEVHMLSIGAFNALLKTLEEPPEHVVFILATTDPHKLPATILSRCQRFDFRRITVDSIVGRLEAIAQAGEVSVEKDAARLIAKMADGALRDAISILDQCISLGTKTITYKDVLSVVGIVNDDFMSDVVDALKDRNVVRILELVDTLVMDGKDIAQFVSDLIGYYRDLLICKISDKPGEIIEASPETLERMKGQCSKMGQAGIIQVIKELSALEAGFKWAAHPRILLEVSLIKICEQKFSATEDDLIARITLLEEKLSSGVVVQRTANESAIKAAAPAMPEKPNRSEPKAAKADTAAVPQVNANVKGFDGWQNILNELKSSGRMAVYTYLLGTRAVELDSSFIGIVFSGSSFNKMIVSKAENSEIIASLLSKKLGREVRVKCLDEKELADVKPQEPVDPTEEKDELVEKAQELAQKLDIQVNILDE